MVFAQQMNYFFFFFAIIEKSEIEVDQRERKKKEEKKQHTQKTALCRYYQFTIGYNVANRNEPIMLSLLKHE